MSSGSGPSPLSKAGAREGWEIQRGLLPHTHTYTQDPAGDSLAWAEKAGRLPKPPPVISGPS